MEIATQSPCKMKMGAIIVKHGEIMGEGFNYAIGERGVHAEFAAINDALRRGWRIKDLWGSRMVIAGFVKSGNFVSTARPCTHVKKKEKNVSHISCMRLLKQCGINEIEYVIKSGKWPSEKI